MNKQTLRKIAQSVVLGALALTVMSGSAYATDEDATLGGGLVEIVEATGGFGGEVTGEGLEATSEILEDTGSFLAP